MSHTSNPLRILLDTARTRTRPLIALAPMADVTDCAFRQIVATYSRHGSDGGGPDIFWTEFVSADGLMSPGREVLMRDLIFSEAEHPIIAQLFSKNPHAMYEAARLCILQGFDGIDINMGCPDRAIEKQGCGAAMIKDPESARVIIEAVRQAIHDSGKDIVLSVKTRIGYATPQIDTWIKFLLEQNLDLLTIHARTRKELSKVPADWSRIRACVELRNKLGVPTVILGNGDASDVFDAYEKARTASCEGVMIGRAVFGNPWLFDTTRTIISKGSWTVPWYLKFFPRSFQKKWLGESRYTQSQVSQEERFRVMLEHARLFQDLLSDIKSYAVMKKHFKAYLNNFKGAKTLRMRAMETKNADELEAVITAWQEENGPRS
jgi:tRNA-dihydrouridine synthase